jgi:hypothetical protein
MNKTIKAWNASEDYSALMSMAYPRSALHNSEHTDERLIVNRRRARLVSCACMRMVIDQIVNKDNIEALKFSESFADGLADTKSVVNLSHSLSMQSHDDKTANLGYNLLVDYGICSASETLYWLVEKLNLLPASEVVRVIRDIVPAPYRKLNLPKKWLKSKAGGMARTMARDIYDNREFEPKQLNALVEFLIENSFPDQEIIEHLSESDEHFLGCWAIDVLQGKRVYQPRTVYDIVEETEWES